MAADRYLAALSGQQLLDCWQLRANPHAAGERWTHVKDYCAHSQVGEPLCTWRAATLMLPSRRRNWKLSFLSGTSTRSSMAVHCDTVQGSTVRMDLFFKTKNKLVHEVGRASRTAPHHVGAAQLAGGR